MKSTIISIAAAVFAFAVPAAAQDAGEGEYLSACASCHGVSAMGDGPMAEFMSVKTPGLTGLSAANDGDFPMLDVIHMIDGRSGIGGHGREMPIWGARFKADNIEYAGVYGAEVIARGRVLALAEYIESIQK
ncbi:MAG: cytochrome c [Rhodobacteraceae bacterium]|nr:cytochrome c [Paracoccaceae bacterium]